MRIGHFIAALVVLLGLSLSTVWQHTRAVRAGYRLGQLEKERVELRERERQLEVKRMQEERLPALEKRALALGLLLPGQDPDLLDLLR